MAIRGAIAPYELLIACSFRFARALRIAWLNSPP
jgi:hypothetical protein